MVDEGSNSMEQGNSVFTIWILQQMKNASFISFSTSFSATKTNTQLQASLRPNSLHFPKVRMHQKQIPQRSHPEARGPRPENTHVLCDVRWYVVVFWKSLRLWRWRLLRDRDPAERRRSLWVSPRDRLSRFWDGVTYQWLLLPWWRNWVSFCDAEKRKVYIY